MKPVTEKQPKRDPETGFDLYRLHIRSLKIALQAQAALTEAAEALTDAARAAADAWDTAVDAWDSNEIDS